MLKFGFISQLRHCFCRLGDISMSTPYAYFQVTRQRPNQDGVGTSEESLSSYPVRNSGNNFAFRRLNEAPKQLFLETEPKLPSPMMAATNTPPRHESNTRRTRVTSVTTPVSMTTPKITNRMSSMESPRNSVGLSSSIERRNPSEISPFSLADRIKQKSKPPPRNGFLPIAMPRPDPPEELDAEFEYRSIFEAPDDIQIPNKREGPGADAATVVSALSLTSGLTGMKSYQSGKKLETHAPASEEANEMLDKSMRKHRKKRMKKSKQPSDHKLERVDETGTSSLQSTEFTSIEGSSPVFAAADGTEYDEIVTQRVKLTVVDQMNLPAAPTMFLNGLPYEATDFVANESESVDTWAHAITNRDETTKCRPSNPESRLVVFSTFRNGEGKLNGPLVQHRGNREPENSKSKSKGPPVLNMSFRKYPDPPTPDSKAQVPLAKRDTKSSLQGPSSSPPSRSSKVQSPPATKSGGPYEEISTLIMETLSKEDNIMIIDTTAIDDSDIESTAAFPLIEGGHNLSSGAETDSFEAPKVEDYEGDESEADAKKKARKVSKVPAPKDPPRTKSNPQDNEKKKKKKKKTKPKVEKVGQHVRVQFVKPCKEQDALSASSTLPGHSLLSSTTSLETAPSECRDGEESRPGKESVPSKESAPGKEFLKLSMTYFKSVADDVGKRIKDFQKLAALSDNDMDGILGVLGREIEHTSKHTPEKRDDFVTFIGEELEKSTCGIDRSAMEKEAIIVAVAEKDLLRAAQKAYNRAGRMDLLSRKSKGDSSIEEAPRKKKASSRSNGKNQSSGLKNKNRRSRPATVRKE